MCNEFWPCNALFAGSSSDLGERRDEPSDEVYEALDPKLIEHLLSVFPARISDMQQSKYNNYFPPLTFLTCMPTLITFRCDPLSKLRLTTHYFQRLESQSLQGLQLLKPLTQKRRCGNAICNKRCMVFSLHDRIRGSSNVVRQVQLRPKLALTSPTRAYSPSGKFKEQSRHATKSPESTNVLRFARTV